MKTNNKANRSLIVGILGLLLLLIGILLFALVYLQSYGIVPTKSQFGTVSEDVLVHVDYDSIPEDALYITADRREYGTGAMQLLIPSIGVDTQVGSDTSPQGLRKMPGLYEFAQMPSEPGGNVSIAGHRDIHDRVFYSLDKVATDNYLYLVYEGNVYQYEFYRNDIVAPTNWVVIERQGFSALTLTTCDPIGTAWNRLVVVGKMIDVFPYTKGYAFPAGRE